MIVDKVIMIIKAVLGETNIKDSFVFSEDVMLFQTGLEFSSIDGVMMVVKLEQEFGVEWPDELLTFNDVLTIGKVSDVMEKILAEKETNKNDK